MQNLISKATCIVWAGALLEMVYAFIDHRNTQKKSVNENDGISIPHLCFVNAALAIEQIGNDPTNLKYYLLEELIPTKGAGGPFRKYLNNTSAVPIISSDAEAQDCVDFLSFAQHVQYYKTDRKAFFSDLQGKCRLRYF